MLPSRTTTLSFNEGAESTVYKGSVDIEYTEVESASIILMPSLPVYIDGVALLLLIFLLFYPELSSFSDSVLSGV